jgi:hypothetical protein
MPQAVCKMQKSQIKTPLFSLCNEIGGRHFHEARVCVVCDRFIISVEKVCKISVESLLKHKSRLGVDSYWNYYGPNLLKEELAKQ